MALSEDLRKRVVEAVVREGMSRNAGGQAFRGQHRHAVRWLQRFAATGEISRLNGRDRRSGRMRRIRFICWPIRRSRT